MESFLSEGIASKKQKKKKKKKKEKKRTANGLSSFYKDGEEGARDVQGLTTKLESLRFEPDADDPFISGA